MFSKVKRGRRQDQRVGPEAQKLFQEAKDMLARLPDSRPSPLD